MFDFVSMHLELANNKKTSVCSLALAEFVDGSLRNTSSWLIKPEPFEIGKEVQYFCNLTESSFVNAPTLDKVWSEISPFLYNKTVVAFHANYQIECLDKTLAYYNNRLTELIRKNNKNVNTDTVGIDKKFNRLPMFDYLCSSLVLRRSFVDIPYTKFEELCEEVGIFTDTKDCKSMAIANGEFFINLLKHIPHKNLFDLKHLLEITIGEVSQSLDSEESEEDDTISNISNEISSGEIVYIGKINEIKRPFSSNENFSLKDFQPVCDSPILAEYLSNPISLERLALFGEIYYKYTDEEKIKKDGESKKARESKKDGKKKREYRDVFIKRRLCLPKTYKSQFVVENDRNFRKLVDKSI